MFFIYLFLILFSNVLCFSTSCICFLPENNNLYQTVKIIYDKFNNIVILYDFVNYCEKKFDNFKEKNFLYKELEYPEIKHNNLRLAIY